MSTGAWYHIDTLKEAYEEYAQFIEETYIKEFESWESQKDKWKVWAWDGGLSLPYRRTATFDEFLSKFDLWYYGFQLLYKGAIPRYLSDMQRHINLAERSYGNLVYLDRSAVEDFGGCLTKQSNNPIPLG